MWQNWIFHKALHDYLAVPRPFLHSYLYNDSFAFILTLHCPTELTDARNKWDLHI